MIHNRTKETALIERVELADTFLKKLGGLMFSQPEELGLVFVYPTEQFISLHMFFVFYPIDVLWLDSGGKVVFLKENFRPFTVVFPPVKARFVVELPEGLIRASRTEVGDLIEIEGLAARGE